MSTTHRGRTALAALVACLVGAIALTAVPSANAAGAAISFNDPGPVTAGPVELRGTVNGSAAETTTVLYVVDNSQSTSQPTGLDCDGNNQPLDTTDNLNGDFSVGDTLDCEIAAVKAVNSSLESSPGDAVVSLETFGSGASAINLNPPVSPPVLFARPGDKGAGTEPLVVTAARKLQRDPAKGTDFNVAVTQALNTLHAAPAGPKYILFLTDGKGFATQSTLDSLRMSGYKLRSFAIGDSEACAPTRWLAMMAKATGDICYTVSSPADLATTLTGSQPANVSSVHVTINGRTFPASVDAIGGWRATLTIGAGTYSATAVATLTDGATITTDRMFTVNPSTTGGPKPSTVSGAKVKATSVLVRRPGSSISAVPARVYGRVGLARRNAAPQPNAGLANATILLQGRSGAARSWATLGSTRVRADGTFAVSKVRGRNVNQLRAVLLAYKVYEKSAATVPPAPISACTFIWRSTRFTAVCHTTANNLTKSRLLRNGKVVARAQVRSGKVRVASSGALNKHVLIVAVSRAVHYRVRL